MFLPNTTCDYFQAGHQPGIDAADISGLPCYLDGDFKRGNSATGKLRWTHRMSIAKSASVSISGSEVNPCRVFVPNESGTCFDVIFVQQPNRGKANAIQQVYLERKNVNWPTQEL